MKLALIVLAALVAVAAAHPDALRAEFKSWMEMHGKTYESDAEHAHRLSVYADNKVYIAGLNTKSKSATFGINKFADLAPAEFRSFYLSKFPATPRTNWPVLEATPEQIAATPASVDWRTVTPPVVTPVKNQGQCGSCWAFSTTGAFEGQWARAGNPLVSLSEQNLVDCSKNCIEYDGQKSCNAGCNGGLQSSADEWIINNGGIESEAEYPYLGVDGTCDFDKTKVVATMTNYTMVSHDEKTMASVCAEKGPIAIAADAAEWQFYLGGVFDLPCGKTLDHGILIVGYGTKKTILGKEHPVWIVKNSWGPTWGEKGYLYIERGVGKCGLNEYPSIPIV